MFESCICSSDCEEYPEFYSSVDRVARKEHECCECQEAILPGETYEYVAAKMDGFFYTVKTCMSCVRVRNSLCPCGNHGELWQEIHGEFCGDPAEGECICPPRRWAR